VASESLNRYFLVTQRSPPVSNFKNKTKKEKYSSSTPEVPRSPYQSSPCRSSPPPPARARTAVPCRSLDRRPLPELGPLSPSGALTSAAPRPRRACRRSPASGPAGGRTCRPLSKVPVPGHVGARRRRGLSDLARIGLCRSLPAPSPAGPHPR
jgi:hypothetical protein